MSNKKKLLIYGTGHFAEYVAYVFENDTDYEVVGFCIQKKIYSTNLFNQKPVFIFEEISQNLSLKNHSLFIAVGNNIIRKRIYNSAKNMGFTFTNYISSRANYWPNLKLGKNIFIDEGCTIQPYVTISDNCILFACNIAHHTTIKSNSLVSVCTTGGNVTIGEENFIGMNTTIKQNVKIGKRNIIGMGCVIEKDTPPESVYTNSNTKKRNLSYNQVLDRFLK